METLQTSLLKTLDQWISFLDQYTIDMLRRTPDADSWSMGQLYMHLIADTNFMLDQIRTALATCDNRDKEAHPGARKMLDRNEFPDRQIVGAPSHATIPQPASRKELVKDLQAIKDAVQALPPGPWEGGKTAHPGLEYFTALEWLQFADMHLRHHLRQKQRIDAAIRHR